MNKELTPKITLVSLEQVKEADGRGHWKAEMTSPGERIAADNSNGSWSIYERVVPASDPLSGVAPARGMMRWDFRDLTVVAALQKELVSRITAEDPDAPKASKAKRGRAS